MKKIIALMLVLVMALSLAACGGNTDPAPSGSDTETTTPSQSTGGTTTPGTSETDMPDMEDIDFSSIIAGNGSTNVIYGELDAAQKQALIDAGKADGVDVTFNSDGSTTFVSEDGETVQKADGTWTFKGENGEEAQIGGNWPDNEFTKLVPKPDFALTAASTEGEGFSVAFADATIDQIRAYAESVKDAGFSIDEQTENQEAAGIVVYSYTAKNAEGYTIEIFSASGVSGLTIYR